MTEKIRQADKRDIPALISLFKKTYEGLNHVPESELFYFERELKASFDEEQVYRILFFAIDQEEQNKIISFAGMAPTLYMDGAWELRWGTTDPEYQRQGLMTKLTEYRIQNAKDKNAGLPGLIQVAARQPQLYQKLGFRKIFERDIENYVQFMIKEI